jgi:hypothetical protein
MRSLTRTFLLLPILLALGCGARSNVVDASSGSSKDGEQDAPLDRRHDVPAWDHARWRDLSKKDHWPWPRDTYPGTGGGSPFGCQVDSDCFGVKCCPTPWGVHLCAADCDQLRP